MHVMRRVLIIVQNLPVPCDQRVWLECQALVSAGHRAARVCPKGRGDPSYQVIDSVELYKYRFRPIGIFLSAIDDTEFIFDHHDLCPDLCESRFPGGPRLPRKAHRALQRRTHKAANHVATNDSYRDMGRARVKQELARSHQKRAHLGVYQRLTAGAGALQRTGS